MPSTSPHSSKSHFTAHSDGPRGEWSLVIADDRCTATRSWRAMLAPYALAFAATLVYYPLSAWLLAQRAPQISELALAVVISIPIIAMVAWVPRLAGERRRIEMSRDGMQLTIERMRLDRARLLEVVLLPHRSSFGTRQRVFITYAVGDFANMIAIASERSIEPARALAIELATWLDLPLSAGTSSPPRARLVRP